MKRTFGYVSILCGALVITIWMQRIILAQAYKCQGPIGCEEAVTKHLEDGQEFTVSLQDLIDYGQLLFNAKFTVEDGAGRPLTKGNGNPLSDSTSPLVFPRNSNRLSGPESDSCAGCHNEPFSGGGGDRVTNVFVLGQRFDFVTFDHSDAVSTRGAMDERGEFVTQDDFAQPGALDAEDFADERKTISMNGSGFIEMLARQMTGDLQAEVNGLPCGKSAPLVSKTTGVSFGTITHNADCTWNTAGVQGLPPQAMQSTGTTPPSCVIQPLSQAGNVVSLRQFTINAMNQHHGMQAEERFGIGVDADGDGIANELTTADITAITVFQATLPVPSQVFSADPVIRAAELNGQRLFRAIRCSSCHIPELPLVNKNWIFTEPDPYNPPGNLPNLQPYQEVPSDSQYPIRIDLTRNELPQPRLQVENNVVMVPAYTDLKLHNITSAPNDPNCEPLNQNDSPTENPSGFFGGNCYFLTRKLWGFANEGPFMHHGKFTTIREAILAHSGEAVASRKAFQVLSNYDQGSVIEFLKTLQVVIPNRAR
jgi:Di-haem oxidoreductase, putative peroxidase